MVDVMKNLALPDIPSFAGIHLGSRYYAQPGPYYETIRHVFTPVRAESNVDDLFTYVCEV